MLNETTLCELRGLMHPWFGFWFWCYIYCLLPYLPFSLHFFHTCLLPYLSFLLIIEPLRFQAKCCKRRLNLALVFCVLFCVVVHHFFWLVNACFCCVSFSFFHTKPGDWLGKRLWNDLFCVEWDVKPTTQSISQPNDATIMPRHHPGQLSPLLSTTTTTTTV